MTLVEVVKIIGDMLTELDQLLSDSGLPSSSPEWEQLFAMRVHMDNLQRRLVTLSFNLDDARFAKLTDQISSADALLKHQIAQVVGVAHVIDTISKVAAAADQILSLAAL